MNAANLLLPIIAGLIGAGLGIYLRGKITRDVKILLAFSGAYLLGLTLLHLLPEIYAHDSTRASYFILTGFLLQLLLDYFSKGIEHGHLHLSDQKLGTFPLGIFLSLCLHSFIEGMPLAGFGHDHSHAGHSHETSSPYAFLLGIAVHKIPEALALAALLYHHFQKKSKVFAYIAIYTLCTPVGLVVGEWLTQGSVEAEQVYADLLAVAVGIFLHVSTTIIFEADEHHRINYKKILAILAGLGLVFLM